ncbi:MAG: hypothetical protein ERJ69_00715 [Aphanocapsa feldmannii 288cV]|nr:MAG: hypothetical protein ERJ69_00715 [Aphanocapsa feldmannii 288cV]
MKIRLKLLLISLGSTGLMLLCLCLGAQNLQERRSLELGFGQRTPPLPSGFVVGISLVAGVLSGSTASGLLLRKGVPLPGRDT